MNKILFLLFICGCSTPFSKDVTLFTKYEELLIQNPGMAKIFECKEIDIKSSKKAMKYREQLQAQLPVLINPNFNGVFRLVDIPLSSGTEWFLADCRTGKFTSVTMTGDLMFSWDSSVLIKNPPTVTDTADSYAGKNRPLPEIYRVDEKGQLLPIENKIQPPN